MRGNILVTWDIDGTILKSGSGGELNIRAIHEAAHVVGNVPLDLDIVEYYGDTFSGTTDSHLAEVLIEKGTQKKATPEQIKEFEKIETEYFIQRFKDLEPCPGVQAILKELSEMSNVTLALCTGNFCTIAWAKVKAAGVEPYFVNKIGGFGHIPERSDMLLEAKRLSEENMGYKFDRVIHIGDAVTDIIAAQKVGAIPVGVETGELKKKDFPKPSFVIKDLEQDHDDFMSIINTGNPIHASVINN